MKRSAATKTADAADTLLAWLHSQASAATRTDLAEVNGNPPPGSPVAGPTVAGSLSPEAGEARPVLKKPPLEAGDEPVGAVASAGPAASRWNEAGSAVAVAGAPAVMMQAEAAKDGHPADVGQTNARLPVPLAHTDWLHHHLAVFGPDDAMAAFQTAAAGAGIVPWQIDFDILAEDLFLRLVSPLPPHPRTLSVAGARQLAAELRNGMARRHALAVACVGHSQACPLDLHALLSVPNSILCIGPDDPAALAWLWRHWGTTQPLRHVEVLSDPARRSNVPGARYTFWSADWTPWPAFADLARRWPTLRFELQPTYGRL